MIKMKNRPKNEKSSDENNPQKDVYTLSLTKKEVYFVDKKMCLAFVVENDEGWELYGCY